jgi:hypothetical protein
MSDYEINQEGLGDALEATAETANRTPTCSQCGRIMTWQAGVWACGH